MSTEQAANNPPSDRIHLDGDGTRLSYKDPTTVTRDRFYEIKNNVRDTADFEVTNRQVLNILMDIYWLHTEHGTAEGQA